MKKLRRPIYDRFQRAVQLAGEPGKLMIGMAVIPGLAAEGDDLPALQRLQPALPVVVM